MARPPESADSPSFPLPNGSLPKRARERAAIIAEFRAIIYRHFREHPRELPWRNTRNPYHVVVSEIMLQQTQVERVREKYGEFIAAFPDFPALARAPLREILLRWQGLGYNRRAVALRSIAQRVVEEFDGKLPSSPEVLATFPGIGSATAASIAVFAFSAPSAFIETNIRRVFIHFFFQGREHVKDREIIPLVEETLDRSDPRTWYCALMDYGVMLKKTHPNPNRKSAHYRRQAPFAGSNRQLRGLILRALTENPALTTPEIVNLVGRERERVEDNLNRLQREGFLILKDGRFSLA